MNCDTQMRDYPSADSIFISSRLAGLTHTSDTQLRIYFQISTGEDSAGDRDPVTHTHTHVNEGDAKHSLAPEGVDSFREGHGNLTQ